MPGIPGMVAALPRANATRNKIWRSMRIMRRFTQPDLVRTTGASGVNVRKFCKILEQHGYIIKTGSHTRGRAGEYQLYRLIRDIGPFYPTRCETCGRPLGRPCIKEEENIDE